MSRQLLQFQASIDAEFAVNTGERTIKGLMVPWGESARTQGKRWRFARGGIKWGHLHRVKLLRDHDNASAMGTCIGIEDTDAGLIGTFKVAPGARGDEALNLAAARVLDGLSIGVEWREEDYGPDPQTPGGYLVRQAALRECSMTAMPAFDSSRLMSVRASDQGEEPVMPEDQKDGQTPATPVSQPNEQQTAEGTVTKSAGGPSTPTPEQKAAQEKGEAKFSVEEFKQLMAVFNAGPTVAGQAGIAPMETPAVVNPVAHALPAAQGQGAPGGAVFVSEPLPYRFTAEKGRFVFSSETPHQLSGDIFDVINSRGNAPAAEKRLNGFIKAMFDVDTTDAAGVIPKEQRPDLWQPQMDYATPLWDMTNSGTTDGTPFELPKYNSSSALVTAATEGTEPAPGAFTVTTQTITPTQLWGKVEITRQLMRRGGRPEISGIIWDQMLREYFEDREAAIATFLNTLTAATDITVTGSPASPTNDNDQTSVASLEAAIADLQFARGGNRFTAFAVHQFLYRLLARVQDDSGRPLYPIRNEMNSNGVSGVLFSYIDVAGTRAVPAYALGAASGTTPVNSWLFDPAKVRSWASPPERLEWNFGATVQTSNIAQLAQVTMGIYGDIAMANLDINGVRQVVFDPNTAA